jgi:DNA-binding transcriptional ArsR family regulator
MTSPFKEIAGLDRLIHEPSRLAILTALSACESADFTFLQNLTGLTAGNLSSHMTKLVDAGLVDIQKQFINNRPNTMVKITEQGFKTIDDYWRQLNELRKTSENWSPEKGESDQSVH